MSLLRRHRVMVALLTVLALGCLALGWLVWAASVRAGVSVAVARVWCGVEDPLPLNTFSYPDVQDAVVPASPTFAIPLTDAVQECRASVSIRNDASRPVLLNELVFPQLGVDQPGDSDVPGRVTVADGAFTRDDGSSFDGDAVIPLGEELEPGTSTSVLVEVRALPIDRPPTASTISTFDPGSPILRLSALGAPGTVVSPIALTFVSGA